MLLCQYCPKSYKTKNGLNKHLQNIHPNFNDKFEYFHLLPKELHYEIFKFLEWNDLLSVFNANITNIFFSNVNFQWKDRFNRTIKYIEKKSNGRKFYFKSWGLTLLKYCNNLCFFCFEKCTGKNTENPFYHLPICRECQKQELPMITKTTAKQKFLLKDSELEKLHRISVPNPHFSKAHDMVLFLEKDCKYLSRNDLNEALYKKELRSQKIKENKQKKILERTLELKNALKKVGLKVRSDSKLCNSYIQGTLDRDEWSLDDVVKMCIEMHWLHTKTNYKELLNKKLEETIDEEMDYYGNYNFNQIYNNVEPIIREKVKDEYNYDSYLKS